MGGIRFDANGHIDLSSCFLRNSYDLFEVEAIAREYFFSELQDLVAWDGKPVRGMNKEGKFRHLVCKHGHDRPENEPINPLADLDIKRIERLPLIKRIVRGEMPVEIYSQKQQKKDDRVVIVIRGIDADYIVVLGSFDDYYIIRSAYPADWRYVRKAKSSGVLLGMLNT